MAAPPDLRLKVDVVELVAGKEVPGNPDLSLQHQGIEYLFATPTNMTTFEKDPARFEVADGGACGSMGPLAGIGYAGRYAVHEGRIYFFASDGCRANFLKDPARCIENAQPAPTGTPEQLQQGLAILDRVVQWAGGEKAIKEVSTYREHYAKTVKSGGKDWAVTKVVGARFPGHFAQKDAWNESWWSTISTPLGGCTTSASTYDMMAESRRLAFERWMARTPIVILKARFEPGFIAIADGEGTVNGLGVVFVKVGFDGATSRLTIDKASGRLMQLAFHGRDDTPFVGDSIRTYTTYDTINGVTLPTQWTTNFDGKEDEKLTVKLDGFEINPVLEPEVFNIAPDHP